MTRKQALAQLKAGRSISTGMLKHIDVGGRPMTFEEWLRYAQLPEEKAQQCVDLAIERLEAKRGRR